MPLVKPTKLDFMSCESLCNDEKRDEYQNRKKQAEAIKDVLLPHHINNIVDGHQLFSYYFSKHVTDSQKITLHSHQDNALLALNATNPMEINFIKDYVSSVEDEFDEKITDLGILDVNVDRCIEIYRQLDARVLALYDQCVAHHMVLNARCGALYDSVTIYMKKEDPRRQEFIARIDQFQNDVQQKVEDYEHPSYPESDCNRRTIDLFVNLLNQIQAVRTPVLTRMANLLDEEEVTALKKLYGRIHADFSNYANVYAKYAEQSINIYREACSAEYETTTRLMKIKHFIKRKEEEESMYTSVKLMLTDYYKQFLQLEVEVNLGCVSISKRPRF